MCSTHAWEIQTLNWIYLYIGEIEWNAISLKEFKLQWAKGSKEDNKTAENLDINVIPEELHILPRDMMVEWLEDKENEKPNSSKKPKLDEQQFGQTVTSIKMLK